MHPPSLAAIDVNLLVVLHAVLSERNLTRAATRLSLSPSATSHALARLRELLGDPLLVRSGRRLDLTPRAVELLPTLEQGLGLLERSLKGEPAFEPRTARRSFTVVMSDYSQVVTLQPLLATLRREAPGITLSAVSFPNSLETIDSGVADLGLLAGAPLPPGFSSRHLFWDGFVCMVRRAHPVLSGPRRSQGLSLATFLSLDHLVVAPTGTPGSMVDSELERRGHTRRIALRVSSFLAAPVLVAQSDLIGTGPERLLRGMAASHPIRLLEPPLRLPRFELQLVWHARRDHDPAHAWLRERIYETREERAPRSRSRPSPLRVRSVRSD